MRMPPAHPSYNIVNLTYTSTGKSIEFVIQKTRLRNSHFKTKYVFLIIF